MLGLAAATLASKYRKIATFDELLERTFFLGKTAIAALLFFIGIPHMVSYLILWTGVFLFTSVTEVLRTSMYTVNTWYLIAVACFSFETGLVQIHNVSCPKRNDAACIK